MSADARPRFTRYAVYVVPEGPFYTSGARWLGWDSVTARVVDHPNVADISAPIANLTSKPRKYGFHATIKAPFALAQGIDAKALSDALNTLCGGIAPVQVAQIVVRYINGFIAIVPHVTCPALNAMAATVVTGLDRFRAPLSQADLARRRRGGLTTAQNALLVRWGYPYVLDEFHFHMTLTGKVKPDVTETVHTALNRYFSPILPQPFVINSLCLMGETADGRFHMLHRYALRG